MPLFKTQEVVKYLLITLLLLITLIYYIKDEDGKTIFIILSLSSIFTLLPLYLFNRSKKSEESLALEKDKKSTPSYIEPIRSNITFKDLAALDDAKKEFKEIISFLKDPKRYIDFGIRMPKGVLLYGAPGVGKTLLAKAVAGEAGVDFFYQSGATFVHIYVGMGAKRVKELFDSAKRSKKAIIFIDELDAIGKSRGIGESDERDATLNQLLIEMDGFDDDSSVVVIAATNNIDILDEALLRSGRFDRRIEIPLPNFDERVEIFRLHLKNKKHSLDLRELANLSVGFTPATIATFVNEAAINALNRGSKELELIDFEKTLQKVSNILHKNILLSKEERELLSIFQASKALLAYDSHLKFSQINLFSERFVDSDSNFSSKSKLISLLKIELIGIIANRLILKESFTNAKESLLRAKKLAKQMIFEYGMGDEEIFGSELELKSVIDELTIELEEYVSKNRSLILKLAKILYEKEHLSFSDIESKKDEIL